ncbi:hypothetical protein ACIGW0_28220 [Streptomyces bikiniensis]|uniref:Uncharacterized protein n=1 Tax=Streptomyces bikiniensis TaxID=1896 RepID=A0ABW8D2A3_STRBI
MSFRLAAYAVCVEGGRVLPTRHVPSIGHVAPVPVGGLVQH